MHAFFETLFSSLFFIVALPVLAFGGFFLMMHGLNTQSSIVMVSGLAAMPIGWALIATAFKFELV